MSSFNITFNRPPVNALSLETIRAIVAALRRAAADHEARGDRILRGRQASEKVGGECGYLEAAMGLTERLADLGEIQE